MTADRTWTAALVVIGDEILSGRTQDKNIAQVATWLNGQGIRLAEVRVVPDDSARIGETVNALRSNDELAARREFLCDVGRKKFGDGGPRSIDRNFAHQRVDIVAIPTAHPFAGHFPHCAIRRACH